MPLARSDVPRRPRAGWGPRLLIGFAVVVLVSTTALLLTGVVLALIGAKGLPTSWAARGPLPQLSGVEWFTQWRFDLIATWCIAGMASAYAAGVWAVHQLGRRWSAGKTWCFAAGLVVCLLATSSSIAVYDEALFSMHMIGHLCLIMIAPALLAAGHPMTLALHATRNPWHTRIKRFIRSTFISVLFCAPVALAFYAAAVVGTHLTHLMDVIMTGVWASELEHMVFLLVGFQFFLIVMTHEPLRWRLGMLAREGLMGVAMAVDTFVGVVLMLTAVPVAMAGMSMTSTAAQQQTQLGGGIMWFGGDALMALLMVLVFATWMRRPEHLRMESHSFLERARQTTFAVHTDDDSDHSNLDKDEAARAAYDAYLQRLANHQ